MNKEKIISFLWKSKTRKCLTILFFLGFIYMVLPGPSKIENFPPLDPSLKSNLEGDTIQNPNIAAFYSDFRRKYITNFYKQKFADLHWFGKFIPPLTLNHPPEYAYQYIRDQQESTFLEEYIYPLRDSLFTNGYEPEIENKIHNKPSTFLGNRIIYKESSSGPELLFESKTTIRFYPSNIFFRIMVYVFIWIAAILLYRLILKAEKEN